MKKEFKIGLVGIAALLALFLGINFLKGKALLNTDTEYYVRFTNAKGLGKSSPVYVDGFEVGIVSDIKYDYVHPGNVLVEISMDPRLVLRHGTNITIEASLMGGSTVNIAPAKESESDKVYVMGDTIIGNDMSGLMGQAAGMIPQLTEIVNKVDTLVTSLNRLTNDPRLPMILDNVEHVTADLTRTTQYLNTVVGKDLPQLARTYNKVGENVLAITENFKTVDLNPTIAAVNSTIANVNAMVDQMRSPKGSLGALMADRSLYNSLDSTIASVDSLMTDIKARPKRYVHFSVFGRKDK